MAKLIPAGADLVLEVHYTPRGEETRDRDRGGADAGSQEAGEARDHAADGLDYVRDSLRAIETIEWPCGARCRTMLC